MKINTSLLISFFFIIPSIFSYFLGARGLASLIAISIGFFFIVTGLFETNNYRSKKAYFTVSSVFIVISLILIFILFSQLLGSNLFSSIYLAAISLILFWTSYDFTLKWQLFERQVISFNKLGLVFILLLLALIAFIEVTI